MIAFFSIILYTDHLMVSIFVVILQVIVFKEMLAVRYVEAKERELWGFRTLNWYFLFGTLFFAYGATVLEHCYKLLPHSVFEWAYKYHVVISFGLYIIGFTVFILSLHKEVIKYQFAQLTWTIMTLLLIVGQSNFVIHNIWRGLFWLLLPHSLIICNDIMAYFCGLALGRRFVNKPLTSLSPNKTWEGFVGSLFCTLLFAFFFSRFLSQYPWFICPRDTVSYDDVFRAVLTCTPDPIFVPRIFTLPATLTAALAGFGVTMTTISLAPIQLHALIFALFASLIAPFGGFFASGIKRAYGKKDFDSLFPGHGGMTDRMDCQFIMGLFTYVYFVTFVRPLHLMDVTGILHAITLLPKADQLDVLAQLQKIVKAAA